MNKKFNKQQFSVINLSSSELPQVSEDTRTRLQYVPFGVFGHDDFFNMLSLAFTTSTTSAACIEGISDLIYGKGKMTFENKLVIVAKFSCNTK